MKINEIKGTITTADGATRDFRIGTDGGWVQWGGPRETLGNTSEALETISRALLEDDLLVSDSDASDVCKHCNESIHQDDNGVGVTIWCHDHGSTVCYDEPVGSIEDGTTAEPTEG